jgi:two-component system, chemotaxis family, protein-glutamate methylesterase/glutaminase
MPVVDNETAVSRRPHANLDLVVLCASAGGIEAMSGIVANLPSDFEAPLLLVQHLGKASRFPELLQRHTRLNVRWAEDGIRLRPRTVYVAPPDRHLSVTSAYRCVLDDRDKVNGLRPSGDVLFASAAKACGPRTLGVVLSGYGRDGARGAEAIQAAGGTVIAQDAAGSPYSGMPDAAIAMGAVRFVLPLRAIPAALVSLAVVPGIAALFPGAAA